MKNILLISFLAIAIIQLNSCDLIDKPEQIPSYVQIDTMQMQIRQASEGTKSHKIKDAWLFVNSQLIGAFEMPMTAVVLEEGEHTIEVFAGISDNGINAIPEVYPFYNRYTTTRVLKPGEVITIEPNITYDEDTKFAFVEDFEQGNLFTFDLDGNPDTYLELATAGRFEGNRSGQITLEYDYTTCEVATVVEYAIYNEDNPASPIYLELNYKNNIPFEVGIMGFDNNALVDKVYIAGMNTKEDWNKIYVNLTDYVANMKADVYKITIRASKGTDVETGEIFLDNIKLLYF